MSEYVLGLDAGATKTVALIARLDGQIIGAGRSGTGDIYSVPAEQALETVGLAVNESLNGAGIQASQLSSGVLCMCGADWPEDHELLQQGIAERGFGKQITILNDAMGGLRAGSPDGTGVAVTCGTGTATGARSADGRFWHSSFWQGTQGAHDMGRNALRSIYRAELGIEPPTTLTARVLAFFAQSRVEQVLHLYTARSGAHPIHRLKDLARIVMEEAEKGDDTARRILHEQGTGLGDYALAAARQVGIDGTPFYLILAGSVLRNASSVLAQALIDHVRASAPSIRPINSPYEPVVGALFLALESMGAAINEPLLDRLRPTLPPSTLYET
jgi:N-acetylglucosamine kinase-like BadF-type ATPase